MKSARKKILSALMAAALALGTFSAPVSAKITTPKTVNVYLPPENSSELGVIDVSGMSKSQKVKKSSVTISNKAVADLNYVSNNSYSGESYAYGTKRSSKYSSAYATIGLNLRKTGTTKVSYKIGSKKYTTTVNVLKYVNPVKSLTISGIEGGKNLASRAASTGYIYDLKLAKTTSNATVKVSAKSGWKVQDVSVYDSSSGSYESNTYFTGTKRANSATLKVNKLVKDHYYSVNITFYNTAKKATITISYTFS